MTVPSWNALFRDHLNAAYECPHARTSPPDSSGTDFGPRAEGSCDGAARAGAFLANAGGSDRGAVDAGGSVRIGVPLDGAGYGRDLPTSALLSSASPSDSTGTGSGPRAHGSGAGADNAGGSGVGDCTAVSSHGVAGIAASSVSAPGPDLLCRLAGFLARLIAPGSELVSAPDLPGLLAAALTRLLSLESLATGPPPQPAVAAQALGSVVAGAPTPREASEAATRRWLLGLS